MTYHNTAPPSAAAKKLDADLALGPMHSSPVFDDEAFWSDLRTRVLPLRPSQYDLTSRCNLTCEGCLFFSGSEYLGHRDESDLSTIDSFFAAEAARGVNYGYFGGAEPSLVPAKLQAAARHIPYGMVVTNGTRTIPAEVPYKLHISVWGRPERSRALRGASMLHKQVRNYRGDERAVFVFTVTAQNLDDIAWIAAYCADNDVPLSFNHYSPTTRYLEFLRHEVGADAFHTRSGEGADLTLGDEHLLRAKEIIGTLIDEKCGRILYTHAMSDLMHNPAGLYADRDPVTDVARDCRVRLGDSLRHYNTDLTRSDSKCCTPNVDCRSCRLYAHSFSTLLTRATRNLRQADQRAPTIALWRLWCALFLNDEILGSTFERRLLAGSERQLRDVGERITGVRAKARTVSTVPA